MKRVCDVMLATISLAILAIPMALLAILVKLTSRGPVLYWSDRVGRDNYLFSMPKFRSMRIDTPEVATHLLADSRRWLTPIGNLLRSTSLDELPQLWCILIGQMSFVGPRPALHNQFDLIALRTAAGIQRLRPGLTGWAQVHGRDELSIAEKVEQDLYYLRHRSAMLDARIVLLTAARVLRQEGIVMGGDAQPQASANATG